MQNNGPRKGLNEGQKKGKFLKSVMVVSHVDFVQNIKHVFLMHSTCEGMKTIFVPTIILL